MKKEIKELENYTKRSATMSDVISYTEALKLSFKTDFKIINSKLDELTEDYSQNSIVDKIKNLEYRINTVETSIMNIVDFLNKIGYRF